VSVSDGIDAPNPLEEVVVADREDLDILRWRFERLLRAGYDGEASLALALDEDVDLHVAEDLLGAGCPVDVALRILG
jgi:hypothetical protein